MLNLGTYNYHNAENLIYFCILILREEINMAGKGHMHEPVTAGVYLIILCGGGLSWLSIVPDGLW